MQNINIATEALNTQMAALLLNSFTINATHVVVFLQNTGSALVEITSGVVNGPIAAIVNAVRIVTNAIGAVIVAGEFLSRNTYNVKLGTIFTEETFQASF